MNASSANSLAIARCAAIILAFLACVLTASAARASTETVEKTQSIVNDDFSASTPLGIGEDKPAVDGAAGDTQDPDDNAGILPQDFGQIEPLGLLGESEGGFGEDVWLGTSRDRAVSLIAQAPEITYYPVVQDMLRRLYLTRAKPEYFSHDHDPDPGNDTLTLRLAKLNEMGLFEYSTKLYSLITDVPYHEKLARAGVLAMMEGGKGSLGCLETRTVLDRFGQLEFWQTLNGICDLRETGGRGSRHPIEGNDIDLTGSESPVIARLAADRSYVARPASPQDIDRLTPLERASLQASGSLSFARFHFNPQQDVSPTVFGMMLGNDSLNESQKFVVLAQSVAFGLRPVSDIQLRYDLTKNDTTRAPTGWRVLAALYAKAGLLDTGPQQAAVIRQAMLAGDGLGGTYALAPYAAMLAASDPDDFAPAKTAEAVRIMIAGNVAVPARWVQRLATQTRDQAALELLLAASADSDLSTDLKINAAQLKQLFDTLPQTKKIMVTVLFTQLGQAGRLHDYMAPDAYEKFMDLTARLDYGMDNSRLASDLLHAYKDKKLGESIVLTAIALRNTRPADLDPKLAGDIVGGMRTVGLTNEARSMAAGVILGTGF